MKVVAYQPQYREDFIRLNTHWIEKYFTMEQADREVLQHVEEHIRQGAMVYFALERAQVIATCMVLPLENHVWEICKLATDEAYQGRGAGSAVLRACLAYAIGHGAREIMLITNHILKPALHIYEKFGFVQTAVEDNPFARADVQYRLDVTKMSAKSDGCPQNPHIAEEKKQ